MPTGLTCNIYDGSDMSLRDFALKCVTQLGAGYYATDQGSKKMPRDKAPVLTPSDYHPKRLKEAEKELQHWLSVRDNPEELNRLYEEEYASHQQQEDDHEETRKERRERYLTMLDKVVMWELPDEYKSLKDLMINQIKESMDFDCRPCRIYKAERQPIDEWIQMRIDMAQRDINYHKEEYAKEVERIEENNAYLNGLYAAIDAVEPIVEEKRQTIVLKP